MSLHIVVCVKHTPSATGGISIDASGKVKTDGLQYAINPFDEYAVEEALRIKERVAGSTVTALSVGPARAEEALRAALALGCDEGVLLSDPSFEGIDSYASAYLLSLAVKKLSASKPVGLALCGKQTNDNESGQVGQALAAWLEWPSAALIKKIPSIDAQKALVERSIEDGVETIELDLPAVLSVVKEINEPRLPSLKGKMASKKAVIPRWGAGDLQADAAVVGAAARVVPLASAPPPARGGGVLIQGASAQEKAAQLVEKLKELKFI